MGHAQLCRSLLASANQVPLPTAAHLMGPQARSLNLNACPFALQIVKSTIMGTASGGRLRLSLSSKPSSGTEAAGKDASTPAADPCGGLQPGEVLEAVVQSVQHVDGAADAPVSAYICELQRPDGARVEGVTARLEPAHLSDHPAGVKALMEVVKAGAKLGE